jgi:hypothetical protein
LEVKESKEGKFKPNEDEMDPRSEQQRGSQILHNGYLVSCG